jgi:hypothetical protein
MVRMDTLREMESPLRPAPGYVPRHGDEVVIRDGEVRSPRKGETAEGIVVGFAPLRVARR